MTHRFAEGRLRAGSLALVLGVLGAATVAAPVAQAVQSRVTAAPVILTNPTDQTVTFDDVGPPSVVFAFFSASATEFDSVLWQTSDDGVGPWTTVPGASTSSLAVPISLGSAGDRYRAGFVNGDGTTFTAPATLIMNTESGAPRASIHPPDQTVLVGGTATFFSTATGNPAPTVEWAFTEPGASTSEFVPGASDTTLTVSPVTAAMNGRVYFAVFTNAHGNASSRSATLTVASTATAPTITEQPSDQHVMAGVSAVFTAAADGAPTPTVQWEVSTDGGTGWDPLPGATSDELTLPGTTLSQGGHQFRAVFTTAGTLTATTAAATLTVSPGPDTAPTIVTNPTNQSAVEGANATFSAAATGTPPPTVQWEVSTDGGGTFTPLALETSTTLTITAATLGQNNNQYRAVFTNGVAPDATTTAATLTVTAAPPTPVAPTVTTNPADQSAVEGANATFTAAATGTPPPTVQWEVSTDGGGTFTPLALETSTTLTITAATLGQNNNQYRAVFTNGVAPDATTTAATLTVTAAPPTPVAPTVTTNPADQSAVEGANATFTAAATGTPTPTVQWQASIGGGPFADLLGETATTLTITGATLTQSGNQYRAVFTNGIAPDAVTTAAMLTVTAAPPTPVAPTVTTNPADQSAVEGANATFTAAATGTPTPTVQWQASIGGGPFADLLGETATTLTITGATLTQSGNQYRAVFTNGIAPDAVTTAAMLTVTAGGTTTPPAIVIDPAAPEPVNVCDPDAPVPAGYHLITGHSGAEVLKGTNGPDLIRGLGGNDIIRAGNGNDIVCGGDGDDIVFGGAGNDIVSGGTGNDTVKGGAGNDALFGGAGDDQLYGGAGNDLLAGGTGGGLENGGPGRDASA